MPRLQPYVKPSQSEPRPSVYRKIIGDIYKQNWQNTRVENVRNYQTNQVTTDASVITCGLRDAIKALGLSDTFEAKSRRGHAYVIRKK